MRREDNSDEIVSLIQYKKTLFITTKNLDYIRVSQECNVLKEYAGKFDIIGSHSKSYPKRILKVWGSLFFKSIKEYEVIFVGFMPQLVMPLFRWKFKNKKVIIDFFISIFDTLVDDRKILKKESFGAKVIKKIDKQTLENADYAIADTRAHANYFLEEFDIEKSKLKIWYLEADAACYHPVNEKKPDNLKNKFVVLYFGSILPVQGVEIIMETISILSMEKDIQFFVIGPINRKIKKVDSENVTYINWLSQEQLAQYISYADLCLAGHFSAVVGKANRTIPGKVYIYLAMHKKVILGDSEANRELFDEKIQDDIFYVKRGDANALAEKIIFVKGNKENV